MRRLLVPMVVIAVVASVSVLSWAKVNKKVLGDYDLLVRSAVIQPGDDAPTRTFFRGTGAATIAADQATVLIDPLIKDDDSVTIDSGDPLHPTRIRGVFAGKGTAAVQVGDTNEDLDVRQVVRVRWCRKGPFIRGAIVGHTEDGSLKLRTALRGKLATPEVEPQ